MGAGKDAWLASVERVLEDAAFERIPLDRAVAKLVGMGFDQPEAETMVNEAVS